MVNEEIFGGLASALFRGESLQGAMMSFYNAGYEKKEIEESARAIQLQGAGQIASQQSQSTPPISVTQKTISQEPVHKKIFEKPAQSSTQFISRYGSPSKDTEELKKEIDTAIHQLKQIKIPSRIKIIEGREGPKPPVIIQKISDYRGTPSKPLSKSITLILVVLLVLLLGSLIAVFFFKEQLIEIFNNLNLG